jgi:DNA-binding MurR/RpiR family transcriptional regulator
MFEQVLRIGEGDVMVGVSFPRYSSRTVKVMQFASNRGARVVAITDSEISPLYSIADTTLLAKSGMTSFADSLVAPLSLVNALIAAVGQRLDRDISATFAELEKIWAEYGVYENVGHAE